MQNGLLPYAELLLFLAGTLLYGFLLRELLRRPDVLPGNRPLRLLAGTLLVWFAGTLLDLWLVFLVGPTAGVSTLGAVLDVVRGLGWLLAPPLLLHTLERLDAVGRRDARGARWVVLVGYLSLGLFAGPIVEILEQRSPYLILAAARFYPRLVLHMAICCLPAAWLAGRLALPLVRGARPSRLGDFLRALRRLLVALVGLFVLGLMIDPWQATPGPASALLRLAILGALLLPGGLFAFHVQRHNLLRLSLSNRFLRQTTMVLVVVAAVMLAGPVLGVDDPAIGRRFVAWGLIAALGWSLLARLVLDPLAEHSAIWRVFSGRAVNAPALDRLMAELERSELDADARMGSTAEAITRWLGSEARFLPRDADTEALWGGLEQAGLEIVDRLHQAPSPLVRALDRLDLHAVVALRVGGDLRGVLGLTASATGGGHGAAELDAVHLVLRQLAGVLALQDLAERRIDAERRAGEQERLGLLGLVSASLAHEIKNPLSAIKALAQGLHAERAAEDPQGDDALDLAAIVEQIDRLDQTTREILGFARPREGSRTELARLLHSAVYVLRAEARKRAVEIVARDAGPSEVDGSPAAWQTIVFNLLKNAVDHTPTEGTVEVELTSDERRTVLDVANPGRIEPAVRDRLFEPFITARDDGTGLGLSLVARRVAEVGATIDLSDDSPHRCDGVERVIFRVTQLHPDVPTDDPGRSR